MRDLVSGTEIQARVQALVDEDPAVRAARRAVIVPMPKPLASEDETGCNWTIHYLGIAGGQEEAVRHAVAIVQNDVNIGATTARA